MNQPKGQPKGSEDQEDYGLAGGFLRLCWWGLRASMKVQRANKKDLRVSKRGTIVSKRGLRV